MDAPERRLTDAVDALVRRARVIAAAEAAGWGAALAALSLPLGAIAAGAIGAARSLRATRRAVVRRADRTGGASNVIVTADELVTGVLQARADIRARVVGDAARRMSAMRRAEIVPMAPACRSAIAAVLCWSLAAVFTATHDRVRSLRATLHSDEPARSAAANALHVSVTVAPPPYTALPVATLEDPNELRVVEGTRVRVRTSRDAAITRDGTASAADFIAAATGYVAAKASDGAQRLIPIVVTPDALPIVRVTAPGRDLVFADGSPRISFEVRASDDFGLGALSLQYTRVSGSGEEYTFDAGEIPIAITRASVREWVGTATRQLSAFGLSEGGMLVYRAVAADTKPGERQSESDAYFIEISRLGVAAGDAFTLPEEQTRYALSEQMLIVKTDRLSRQRASMPASRVTEASQNLAVEQRAIRAEFVFMLGGEIEDEEVEAAESIDLQAGRQANRGQSDLRDATRAMSQAEKYLTGSDVVAALAAERAAVAALQRAFARDRYLLRALASRTPLDAARRLTGNRSGAREVRNALANSPENRMTARIQDLLDGIGALARDAVGAPVDPARAAVLAETALSIDPGSVAMRDIASDIQRGALNAAASSLAAQLRRALAAAPPALPSAAPALQRALETARGGR